MQNTLLFLKALKKNINPTYDYEVRAGVPQLGIPGEFEQHLGPGYLRKYASRAHQNINAMNQERLDQMLGVASLNVDEDEDELIRFRDAENWAEYNAPRRANRYWNRGDARTIPQRFMGGLRNVGGDIMGGIRTLGQGIGNFMGNRFQYKPAVSPAGGYSAAQLNQMNARGGYYTPPGPIYPVLAAGA